jgi:hypothetical protein
MHLKFILRLLAFMHVRVRKRVISWWWELLVYVLYVVMSIMRIVHARCNMHVDKSSTILLFFFRVVDGPSIPSTDQR